MVGERIAEFGAGISIIIAGTFLLVHVRKIKEKLRKFILRREQNEQAKKIQ